MDPRIKLMALIFAVFYSLFCCPPFGDLQVTNAGVEQRLEAALEDVALAQATEARLEETLSRLRAEIPMNSNAVATTETYLSEVSAMVQLHEKRLANLQALVEEGSAPNDDALAEGLSELEQVLDQQSAPETGDPELAALDNELQMALAKFDGLLLDKLDALKVDMDRVTKSTAAEASTHAQAAAEAAALLRDMGVDPEVSSEVKPTKREPVAEKPANQNPLPERSPSEGAPPPVREQDEDIVARQLREAAEQEADPVLREKLWKEYEAYLSGSDQ